MATTNDTQVDFLFQRYKKHLQRKKRIVPLGQPIVILLRSWHDIEIYENIKGNTFIIPPPPEHKQPITLGDQRTKLPGKRVAYLSPSDIYTLPYGNDVVKAYVIHEEDAAPIGSKPQVWSERLEYTVDAILANYENYKKGDPNKNKWIVDLVKWGGLVVIIYFMLKWILMPEEAATSIGSDIGAAAQQLSNVTGITIG